MDCSNESTGEDRIDRGRMAKKATGQAKSNCGSPVGQPGLTCPASRGSALPNVPVANPLLQDSIVEDYVRVLKQLAKKNAGRASHANPPQFNETRKQVLMKLQGTVTEKNNGVYSRQISTTRDSTQASVSVLRPLPTNSKSSGPPYIPRNAFEKRLLKIRHSGVEVLPDGTLFSKQEVSCETAVPDMRNWVQSTHFNPPDPLRFHRREITSTVWEKLLREGAITPRWEQDPLLINEKFSQQDVTYDDQPGQTFQQSPVHRLLSAQETAQPISPNPELLLAVTGQEELHLQEGSEEGNIELSQHQGNLLADTQAPNLNSKIRQAVESECQIHSFHDSGLAFAALTSTIRRTFLDNVDSPLNIANLGWRQSSRHLQPPTSLKITLSEEQQHEIPIDPLLDLSIPDPPIFAAVNEVHLFESSSSPQEQGLDASIKFTTNASSPSCNLPQGSLQDPAINLKISSHDSSTKSPLSRSRFSDLGFDLSPIADSQSAFSPSSTRQFARLSNMPSGKALSPSAGPSASKARKRSATTSESAKPPQKKLDNKKGDAEKSASAKATLKRSTPKRAETKSGSMKKPDAKEDTKKACSIKAETTPKPTPPVIKSLAPNVFGEDLIPDRMLSISPGQRNSSASGSSRDINTIAMRRALGRQDSQSSSDNAIIHSKDTNTGTGSQHRQKFNPQSVASIFGSSIQFREGPQGQQRFGQVSNAPPILGHQRGVQGRVMQEHMANSQGVGEFPIRAGNMACAVQAGHNYSYLANNQDLDNLPGGGMGDHIFMGRHQRSDSQHRGRGFVNRPQQGLPQTGFHGQEQEDPQVLAQDFRFHQRTISQGSHGSSILQKQANLSQGPGQTTRNTQNQVHYQAQLPSSSNKYEFYPQTPNAPTRVSPQRQPFSQEPAPGSTGKIESSPIADAQSRVNPPQQSVTQNFNPQNFGDFIWQDFFSPDLRDFDDLILGTGMQSPGTQNLNETDQNLLGTTNSVQEFQNAVFTSPEPDLLHGFDNHSPNLTVNATDLSAANLAGARWPGFFRTVACGDGQLHTFTDEELDHIVLTKGVIFDDNGFIKDENGDLRDEVNFAALDSPLDFTTAPLLPEEPSMFERYPGDIAVLAPDQRDSSRIKDDDSASRTSHRDSSTSPL